LVKIRLKRVGTTKRPYYRLVVADSRSPRDGRFIEALGHYDPLSEPVKVEIDGEKVKGWIANGARPTDAARSLLEQAGVLARGTRREIPLRAKRNPEKAAARQEEKAKKAAAPVASTEPAEAPTTEASETESTEVEEEPTPTAEAAEVPAAEGEDAPDGEADASEAKAEDESGS
jgi:small subunit ribosomal protein S16